MNKQTTPLSVRLIAYAISLLLAFLGLLILLFLIALGSELTMPFVARDRPSGNGLYDHSDTLGWKIKPNLNLYLESKRGEPLSNTPYFSTTPEGYRSTPAIDSNKRTSIVLGDSFAQGYYLSDQETIAWQLANKMDSNIINTGVGAYSSDQELLMLERTIRNDTEWVILLLCANDISLNMENESWGLHKPRFQTRYGKVDFEKLNKPVKKNQNVESTEAKFNSEKTTICCAPTFQDQLSYSTDKFKNYLSLWKSPSRLAQQIREDYKWLIPFKSQYSYILPPSFYQNPLSMQTEWAVTLQIIERMKAVSEKHGAKFLAVYIPEIAQVLNRDSLGEKFLPQQYFMHECEIRKINCLDPSAVFSKNAGSVFVQDDGHLSPFGAQLISSEIVTAMYQGNLSIVPASSSNLIKFSTIAPNQVIEFGKGKIGEQFLINVGQFLNEGWGWTYPEPWGAWSEGNRAKIVLPLPNPLTQSLHIRVQALTSAKHPYQDIEILVNKEPLHSMRVTKTSNTEIVIPLNHIQKNDRFITVEFRIPKPVTPQEIGLGPDNRQIALGIISAQFQ